MAKATPVAALFFYTVASAGLGVRLGGAVGVAVWFTTSVVLHFLARWILRGLR